MQAIYPSLDPALLLDEAKRRDKSALTFDEESQDKGKTGEVEKGLKGKGTKVQNESQHVPYCCVDWGIWQRAGNSDQGVRSSAAICRVPRGMIHRQHTTRCKFPLPTKIIFCLLRR